MVPYDVFFWLSILGGNLIFFLMLRVIRLFFKRDNFKNINKFFILLIGLFIMFVILNPLFKIIELPGLILGVYGNLSTRVRFVVGFICAMIFAMDIPCYQFIVFKLKFYLINKQRYTLHIYHNLIYLTSTGLWIINLFGTMVFLSAIFGNYKISWNWGITIILVIEYIGKIVLSLLDSQRFTMKDNRYSYCNFKKRLEGSQEEIQLVELVNDGIVLHINGEKIYIRCLDELYLQIVCNQLSNPRKNEI